MCVRVGSFSMSDEERPSTPPPEVPDEYAEAYRAAYERALAEPEPVLLPLLDEDEDDDDENGLGDEVRAEQSAEPEQPVEQVTVEPAPLPVPLTVPVDGDTDGDEGERPPPRRPGWLAPVLLGLIALLLVVAAYVFGRVLSHDVEQDESSDGAATVSGHQSPQPSDPPAPTKPVGPAWKGALAPVAGVRAATTCTAPEGQDATGRAVRYVAAHMVDQRPGTTWRCAGEAIGQRITLTLPGEVQVGAVGLIPGYAKTDATSGADRYAENNRLTRVRWIIGDTVVEQTFDGSAKDRSLRTMRVPKTAAREIKLEILGVAKGPRNTTAISTVQVSAAR